MRCGSLHATPVSSPDLVWLYARTMAGYLLIMAILWYLGLEGIYGHPTPFYALFAPAVGMSLAVGLTAILPLAGALALYRPVRQPATRLFFRGCAGILAATLLLLYREAQHEGVSFFAHLYTLLPKLAWQLPALAVFAAGTFALHRIVLPRMAADTPWTKKETRNLLLGIFFFSVAFACAVAMIRGGFHGIEQAYDRSTYEYIGDIGKTRNIRALFSRYLEIHEHLSMHAKVHPPGPIALLWLFSLFLFSASPATLSIATILFGATAIFPLYGWAKRLAGQRTAILACLCYAVVPSVVLFTATSADILFTPFTLGTLYCFERSIRTRSIPFALAAGLGYGAMMLLKFSLIGIGAYFGLVGLWMLRNPQTRWNVIQTAALMLLGTGAVIGGVYLWSGFNIYETFQVARRQFDTDQLNLDELTPRLPAWTYRILNPACWFYFAGIPMSLLFLKELLSKASPNRPCWIVFLLTLVALNFLYVARGEGERSALYLIPFVVIPAACYLERLGKRGPLADPVMGTLAFLAFQCWFTETFFYTYW